MVTTRTPLHAAPSRRPAGVIRRLLDRLRRRPLAVGVVVVAVITLAASAHQNARGRADTAPPPVAAPTFDDCVTTECLPPDDGVDIGGEAGGWEAGGWEAGDVDTGGEAGGGEAGGETEDGGAGGEGEDGGAGGEGEDGGAGGEGEDGRADSGAGAGTGTVPERTSPPAPPGTEPHRPGTGPRVWPLVRSGARGETVAAIQLLLASHGYRTDTDAVFGPATTAQVTSYQRDRSLADDGIVGPDTWHALIVDVRTGDRGPAVLAAQRLLTAHGHPVTADGVFGQETALAVTAFQTDRRLVDDGIVGPDTWSALVDLA